VSTTARDKKAIVAKARRLNLSVAELMRRGALAYEADEKTLAGRLCGSLGGSSWRGYRPRP
jgi:hypothetical protein